MTDETGWLIEVVTPNGPCWWTAGVELDAWSYDVSNAVRFSRELDAWRVIRGQDLDAAKPTRTRG